MHSTFTYQFGADENRHFGLELSVCANRYSFEVVGAVKGVALGGDEAGVRDDAAEFVFVGAIFHAGGEDYVFFDQDAADVIGAELQSDLTDFDSGGEPAGLDVIDVVEIEAADGERFQIVDRGGFLHFFAERGVFRGEHPGDEGGKASSIFLNAANAVKVVDAMAKFFAAAEHHGGGGAQSEGMGDAMDFFPIVAGAFEARDFGANFVVENFRAAARDGLQAGVHQALNGFAHADFGNFSVAQVFGGGEEVQMTLRKARFQRALQIFVVADLQVGMQSALQQNSGAAELQHLFNFRVDGFKGEDVAVFGAERAVEGAVGAVIGAEVGVIDVAIDLVSDHARVVLGQAHLMRLHAEADQVVGVEHVDGLLFGQAHGFTSILAENGPKVGMSERLNGSEDAKENDNAESQRTRRSAENS